MNIQSFATKTSFNVSEFKSNHSSRDDLRQIMNRRKYADRLIFRNSGSKSPIIKPQINSRIAERMSASKAFREKVNENRELRF